MTEQLHFSALWPYWPALLAGLWVTIQLTVMATLGGLAIGIFGAAIRSGPTTWFSRIWGGYVEIIRNTPFVVQLFFIVFGLPNLGLKMTAGEAALLFKAGFAEVRVCWAKSNTAVLLATK